MRKKILPLLAMALMMSVPFGATAQTGVENYVSASGYVIYHAPAYYTGNDGYAFDFEADYMAGRLQNWTTIDADGDGNDWKLFGETGYGHHGSEGVVVSYSYNNTTQTVLSPDNYLVSPQLSITEGNKFLTLYARALDEDYPSDHFGVAVSTTNNEQPSAFTMVQEWTMTAKGAGREVRGMRSAGERVGNWHHYTVDLSDYVGQDIYLAIRHFNSTNNFCLCVDDVVLAGQDLDALASCNIILDGQIVAENQNGMYYLLNTDGFADGSTHTTTIQAVYQSGVMMQNEQTWTYRTSDHFQGSPSGLRAESDGSLVQLSWTLPEMSVPFQVDELYYDFADSTFMDLTLIDANNDGQNFRIYPYGGYGGGIGLRSWSWMSGADNLNPDNFIVTPRVTPTENARISFMACDADMPGIAPDPEHFGVAVSTSSNTNPNDFVMVQEWNSTGTYTEYAVDLSAYAGQPIYIAIRHFNTTGECYFLCVDDIKVTGVEADVTRPAVGALVYANDELIATLNHGETSFTHMVNRYTSEYCIRIIQEGSRETGDYYALAAPQCADAELDCVAPKNLRAENLGDKVRISWEREIYTGFEEDPQGWTFLDANGDGFNFGIYAAGGMNSDGSVNTTGTNASLSSFSFINDYGALTPDNYAFMPKVKVLENASMTFYAAGYDPNYASEHFGVAVASSDGMNVATIDEWDTRNTYQAFTVDLSVYAGYEIFLGFRHFTQVANYALCIDNITVTNVVWAGTSSETYGYYVYRSTDGQNYDLIGLVTGSDMHFDDNESSAETYYYQVTAINTVAGGECESAPAMSVDMIHNFVTAHTDGIAEIESDANVYPNPAHHQITVEAEGMSRVTLINMLGQMVYDAAVEGGTTTISLADYESGLYIVRINTENGVITKQISVVR